MERYSASSTSSLASILHSGGDPPLTVQHDLVPFQRTPVVPEGPAPPLLHPVSQSPPPQGAVGDAPLAHVTAETPAVPSRWTAMGPAASTTSMPAPSEAFTDWLISIERRAEDRLLHEARERFFTCGANSCYPANASLYDLKCWLSNATRYTDEVTPKIMRAAQLEAWLLTIARRRLRRGAGREAEALDCRLSLPNEVKERIDGFVGGTHVWGPVTAARARLIAESSLRRVQRYEGVLRTSALAVLGARYVHPAVMQAAEAGYTECTTEVPTDDLALQALFEVSVAEAHPDVGCMLVANLAKDGFAVKPTYHDPAYGLWRAFWVGQCDRINLRLEW